MSWCDIFASRNYAYVDADGILKDRSLNFFQQLGRKYFKCFFETRLSVVANKVNERVFAKDTYGLSENLAKKVLEKFAAKKYDNLMNYFTICDLKDHQGLKIEAKLSFRRLTGLPVIIDGIDFKVTTGSCYHNCRQDKGHLVKLQKDAEDDLCIQCPQTEPILNTHNQLFVSIFRRMMLETNQPHIDISIQNSLSDVRRNPDGQNFMYNIGWDWRRENNQKDCIYRMTKAIDEFTKSGLEKDIKKVLDAELPIRFAAQLITPTVI